MKTRYIDWIWNVRGSLAIAPGQSGDDTFAGLDPLFRQPGTSHQRTGDTLVFQKKNQPAQDKMSVFDRGVLTIERGAAGSVLRYRLTSRALLFCFLAPLLFLGIAQLTIAIGHFQNPPTTSAGKHGKAANPAKKKHKPKPVPMNFLDKALGAPAPDPPGKKGADKDDDDKKPSPTTAYVLAAIFATLYVAGRILEEWLVKKLLKQKLIGT